MTGLSSGTPHALLEQPVFDVRGQVVGRIAAVGTRHWELHRIGIERPGPELGPLGFVGCERFMVEGDRVVLTQ